MFLFVDIFIVNRNVLIFVHTLYIPPLLLLLLCKQWALSIQGHDDSAVLMTSKYGSKWQHLQPCFCNFQTPIFHEIDHKLKKHTHKKKLPWVYFLLRLYKQDLWCFFAWGGPTLKKTQCTWTPSCTLKCKQSFRWNLCIYCKRFRACFMNTVCSIPSQ